MALVHDQTEAVTFALLSGAGVAVVCLPVDTLLFAGRGFGVLALVAAALFVASWVVCDLDLAGNGWRFAARRRGAPSQVEIARRIREATGEPASEQLALPLPNRLEAGGMGRCRRGLVS